VNEAPPLLDEQSLRIEIQRQVDYYFSDLNLPKDQFIIKHMDMNNGGAFPIHLLLTFPKMKKLLNKHYKLVEAWWNSTQGVANSGAKPKKDQLKVAFIGDVMQNSQRLQVTNDLHLKLKVEFDLSSLKITDDNSSENKTLYVAYLPRQPGIQEIVQREFSVFGAIKKLNIPEDLKTGGIKGIAFIEYETNEQAEKALQFWKQQDKKGNRPSNELDGIKVKKYLSEQHSILASPTSANSNANTSPSSNKSKQKKKKKKEKDVTTPEAQPATPPTHTSIYEQSPTFSYSKSTKRRSNSQSDSTPSTTSPTTVQPAASTRPKLNLIRKDNNTALNGIVPVRQPLGPPAATAKGFSFGRGKTLPASVV